MLRLLKVPIREVAARRLGYTGPRKATPSNIEAS
jgi:hypothetical protein